MLIFPLRPIDVRIIVSHKVVQLFLGYSRVLSQQAFVGAKVIGLSAHPALVYQLVAMVAFPKEVHITLTDYPSMNKLAQVGIYAHQQVSQSKYCSRVLKPSYFKVRKGSNTAPRLNTRIEELNGVEFDTL